jgi:hypothetical protein
MDQALTDLALEKLGALLGAERARVVFQEVLTEARLEEIGRAQDLLTFGDTLKSRGGVEGAVGSILGFQALLRGAGRSAPKGGRATSDQP